jgi:hypothetical protein
VLILWSSEGFEALLPCLLELIILALPHTLEAFFNRLPHVFSLLFDISRIVTHAVLGGFSYLSFEVGISSLLIVLFALFNGVMNLASLLVNALETVSRSSSETLLCVPSESCVCFLLGLSSRPFQDLVQFFVRVIMGALASWAGTAHLRNSNGRSYENWSIW